jgi:hypothetical protein
MVQEERRGSGQSEGAYVVQRRSGPAPTFCGVSMVTRIFAFVYPMSKFDFESVVRQEEAYLRLVHPTPDDIPGCISLFDTYLSCNGMR